MYDCVIVGGGVVGLSLAYELSGGGMALCVLDKQEPGREASWAGAGILAPAAVTATPSPWDQLHALSQRLHPAWAASLRDETGIDTGYRRCGALYLTFDESRAGELAQSAGAWRSGGVEVQEIGGDRIADVEPHLRPLRPIVAAFHLPEEAQLRNPWHLRALLTACQRRGVRIRPWTAARRLVATGTLVRGVETDEGIIPARRVCLTAGPWTGPLLTGAGARASLRPIRGQMVLFSTAKPLLSRIVNVGHRYLVPRPDGRLLVGSTEEDVGFDNRTTAGGVEGLIRFARRLVPELANSTIEKAWAGLRPCTADGLPYLDRVPPLENLFVAAGHYRAGLTLSTGTAVVMARLIRGEEPGIDLSPFRLGR